ncbi:MAG: chemotaxis response regulator protein-glutamate methylesterase [Paracoccus sp. (in: a-proteobacteria)]|nr:chemotaxis response regulator protein-glutamate methylesterase [Paracoccus sp. (in: a-proteobacteria)]
MTTTKVLVVDDSSTMRHLLRFRLRQDARIDVVGEASNADEARAQIARLSPDVLTLDVEMPGLSGLDFLREIMRTRPMPVIMISSETQKGSAAAIEALSRGAIDCLGKPRSNDPGGGLDGLAAVVLAAKAANLPARAEGRPRIAQPSADFHWNGKFVLIGSSTGGVDALEQVFSRLPENCPPVLVTQHMPESFLASFAHRMNSLCPPNIRLAEHGQLLERGTVLIAPGGAHHLTVTCGLRPRCQLLAGDKVSGHRPSVDMLFRSALPMAERIIAVLLTGMGTDGAGAMLGLRHGGAACFAQDQASSVVWGMPRVAWENGGAQKLLPLESIAREILTAADRRSKTAHALR